MELYITYQVVGTWTSRILLATLLLTAKPVMFKLFTTFCFTVLSVFVFGQSVETFKVSGIVISANSGEPIPDGVIMISRTQGYRCDSFGRFILYNLPKGQHKLSFSAFGYNSKDTVVTVTNADIYDIRWTIYTDCWNYNKEKALKDIQSNRPAILLQSGIAPVVYTADKDFEERYKVTFYDFGCVAADRQECLTAYNKIVFEYLDKTYGKKWRREIRRDAIGLKNK
jgi:hypothetical protein